jgi:protein phosphatase
MLGIQFYGASDRGLLRADNEDDFLVSPEFLLCVVSDGMGGAPAGEHASRLFTETAQEVFSKYKSRSEQETLQLVQRAFLAANERIRQHAKQTPQHLGMGCTAEMLAFAEDKFVIGHVGDSRTYRCRDGHLQQLTRDHTYLSEVLGSGSASSDSLRKHAFGHAISRAVGGDDNLSLDIIRGQVVSGEIYLLCSDGLTDMVKDPVIESVLSSGIELPMKVQTLLNMANSAGGHDNITIVVSEVRDQI